MHCVLFVSIPKWMPFSSHSDRSSWRSECFLFSIFAMKPLLSPNSFTKSDGFYRNSGKHLPITTCHKASSGWDFQGTDESQEGCWWPWPHPQGPGAGAETWWPVAGERNRQARLFSLIPFPLLQLLQQSPHHAVSDTEPSHQVWQGSGSEAEPVSLSNLTFILK